MTDIKNRVILLNVRRKQLEEEMEEYIKEVEELYSDFLAYNGLFEKYSVKNNDVRFCVPYSEILAEIEEALKKNNKKDL